MVALANAAEIIEMIIWMVGFCIVPPLPNRTNRQIISEMLLPKCSVESVHAQYCMFFVSMEGDN
jgi:hypothetical protein